jgi:hypothetical protein
MKARDTSEQKGQRKRDEFAGGKRSRWQPRQQSPGTRDTRYASSHAATKIAPKMTLITPFTVKKATFTRERSSGFTSECW